VELFLKEVNQMHHISMILLNPRQLNKSSHLSMIPILIYLVLKNIF
jgi:hypothetical protein